MDWDTEKVTAKNAEVQQSRDSLLDFIDKTQAELQALADRLKVSMLHRQVLLSEAVASYIHTTIPIYMTVISVITFSKYVYKLHE